MQAGQYPAAHMGCEGVGLLSCLVIALFMPYFSCFLGYKRDVACVRRLAQLGNQTMLQMMLVDNLIHSDLHPGNILVALVCALGAPSASAVSLYLTFFEAHPPKNNLVTSGPPMCLLTNTYLIHQH